MIIEIQHVPALEQNEQDKTRENHEHLGLIIRRLLIAKAILQECMFVLTILAVGSYIAKYSPVSVVMFLITAIVWFGSSLVIKLRDGLSPSVQSLPEFHTATKGAIRDGVFIFSAILLFAILWWIASKVITAEDVVAVSAVGLFLLILVFLVVVALLGLCKHEELMLLQKTPDQT